MENEEMDGRNHGDFGENGRMEKRNKRRTYDKKGRVSLGGVETLRSSLLHSSKTKTGWSVVFFFICFFLLVL